MSRLPASCLAVLLVGCAGSTPPPDAPPKAAAKDALAQAASAEPPKAGAPGGEAGAGAKAEEPAGRMDPAEIQKVVRANFKSLRACYEAGLQKNPNLEGRIGVRFVIGKDGRVSDTGENEPSTIPDPAVVKCVVDAFGLLQFPAPENVIVKVVYPIMFSPAGGDEMSNCKKTAEEKDGIRTVSITCERQTLKVTDMPARAVDDKFADAILTGFEQQSPKMRRTRGKPTIADKPCWTTLVDGQTWVSTLLVTEVTPGRALVVSCLDEGGGTRSGRCDSLVEFIVKREVAALTAPGAPGAPAPKRPIPTGGTTGSGF